MLGWGDYSTFRKVGKQPLKTNSTKFTAKFCKSEIERLLGIKLLHVEIYIAMKNFM